MCPHAPGGGIGKKDKDAIPDIRDPYVGREGGRQAVGDTPVDHSQLARPVDEALQAGGDGQSVSTKRFAQEGAPQP